MNVTGTIEVYDNFLLERDRGNVHPESDLLVAGLSGSGYVPSIDHTDINAITDELAGFGYARQALTNVALLIDNHVVKLACDDFAFEAIGAELVPRFWWVFDDTHPADILVCFGLINEQDEDVVMIPGQPLTLHINANGLIRSKR